MSANDDRSDHPQEPDPASHDDLDALLREWHQGSAERAAGGRDRLLSALAEQSQRSPTAASSGWAPSAVRAAIRRLGGRRPLRIAASILVLVGLGAVVLVPDWPSRRRGAALATDLREVGFAPPLLVAGQWPNLDDERTVRQAEQAVTEARALLAEALSIDDPDVLDPWIPLTELGRNLRAMGCWEEALAEALEFLAYAEKRDREPDRFSMRYTALSDVGNIYLALGDYETARSYHEESLAVARDYTDWAHRTGRFADPRPHAFEATLVSSVAPPLWMLSRLAAARGDQQTAWEYHNQAGELLLDYFRKDCAFRNLAVRADASVHELCRAVANVALDEASFRTPAIMVRQHLLHEAELLRLDQAAVPPEARDLTAAGEALFQAGELPCIERADDFRQDFHIPMEALRIAIARGDWPAALSAADEAAEHTGPRYRPGLPDQEPIGVLARAELRFLRGTALAGLDPTKPEALTLIESAIDAVEQSAAPLLEAQRRRLLDRFAEWSCTADQLRRKEWLSLSLHVRRYDPCLIRR